MLHNLYLNACAVIKQWFENIPRIADSAPVPVRIRIDQTERAPHFNARQQRRLRTRSSAYRR